MRQIYTLQIADASPWLCSTSLLYHIALVSHWLSFTLFLLQIANTSNNMRFTSPLLHLAVAPLCQYKSVLRMR